MIRADDVGLEVAKSRGHEVLVRCPFHDDHHPSAWFNTRTGLFYCFACGASKNALQLAEHNGLEPPDEFNVTGVWLPSAMEIEADEYEWSHFLSGPLALGNHYLADRGVTNDAIIKHDIRESSGNIVFPMCDTLGKPTGVIVRQIHRAPKYLILGKRTPLWPMKTVADLTPGEILYVTEGVFGVLRGETTVNARVVSILGTQGVGKFLKFREFNKGLLNNRVVAIMDPDLAGQVAAAKLAMRGVRVTIGHTQAPDEWSEKTWLTATTKTDRVTTTNMTDVARTVKKDDRGEFYKLIKGDTYVV